ncbi:MAG: hypothetical protein JWQ73_235 [Variovorax sp.]|nr:hypothetical protein [Variovorax sp.]
MRTLTIAALTLLAAALPAAAQTTAFDGNWRLTLSCPPTSQSEGAKGYDYVFPTRILNGELQAVRGTEGEPGWQYLHGPIGADGSAALVLDGVVNLQEYAIGKSPKGKSFTYPVTAKFTPTSGTGQRMTGRSCNFVFVRLP